MPQIQINKLNNANIYSGSNSLLGKAEEITLPAIKGKHNDHKALGMIGDIELPNGFEKMTGKIRWNSVYEELIEEFGSPYVTKNVQVRSSLETWDSSGKISEVSVVAFMALRFKDVLPPITIKQNDNSDLESEYSCTYYRLEIDGDRQIEIDFFTNMFFVGDSDMLENYRNNLGI